MEPPPAARIDKWLWAARVFRTRSAAIAACNAGHVKVQDHRVKPAREVRPGDVLTVLVGEVRRSLRVRAAIEQRVGAGRLAEVLEDLTPPEEFERARADRLARPDAGLRGGGRPTKRDRRRLDALEF